MLRSCFLLALLPLALFAQTDDVTPGMLDGRVVNSVTGDGVGGATVSLTQMRFSSSSDDESNLQATARPDGTFHLEGLPPGSYLMSAEQSGYALLGRANHRFITINAGQSVNNVSIALAPNSVVAGKVLDEAGKPIASAKVIALAQQPRMGRTLVESRGMATSTASGAFSLGDLRAGTYYIAAEPSSTPGKFVRTFYPRSLDLDGASTLVVTPGQPIDDVVIYGRQATVHQVRGKLADDTGAEFLRADLSPRALVNSEALSTTAKVNADGTFVLDGVLPGSYTLRMLAGRRRAVARQEIEVGGGDVTGLVLNRFTAITLSGTVSIEGNSAAQAARVQVFARPLEAMRSRPSMATAYTGADFSLTNLDPEPYVMRLAVSPAGLYIKSVLLNGVDVNNRVVDLSNGSGGKLDIVLRSGTAEIDGSVAAVDNTMPGVAVVVVPQRVAPDGANITFSYARAGAFTITNLAPDSYRLFAVQQPDPNLWHNPSFIQQVQTSATVVDVAEGQHAQLQLTLLLLDTIENAAQQAGLSTN